MPEDSGAEVEKIQQLGRELAALPATRVGPTKRQVVALLAGDIQRARDKGYTLKQIAQHLQSRGIDIGYSTLRAVLPRQKKARRRKTPRVAPGASVLLGEGAPVTAAASPPSAPENPPDAAASTAVLPGAASVPAGEGRFIPAPDSEIL